MAARFERRFGLLRPVFAARAASPVEARRPRFDGYRAVVVALLALVATIAIANAVTFPGYIGYDRADHRAYADLLVHHGHIPNPAESHEFNSPPGFYAVSGIAVLAAEHLGAADPWKVARALNVVWALGTAILTLLTARLVFPRQPALHVAALAFVVLIPVFLKMASMFHPEQLSLFISTLALYLGIRMFARRSFRHRDGVLLGLVLAAGQLVRAFSLWTFAVVIIALIVAGLSGFMPIKQAMTTTLMVVATTGLVAGPWYIRQTIHYSNPLIFNQPPRASHFGNVARSRSIPGSGCPRSSQIRFDLTSSISLFRRCTAISGATILDTSHG